MAKKVIVLLAEGFEEVEAITPIDYLRRAGIELTVAAVGLKAKAGVLVVAGSHNIPVIADAALETMAKEKKLAPSAWDGVVVPGGPGVDRLAASKETGAFLTEMAKAGKWICAICAAPAKVLSPLGLLAGKKFTCYPGLEDKVAAADSASPGAKWKKDRVVVDGSLITSRGAGTAGEFAYTVISKIVSEAEAKNLAEKVLLSY